MDGYGPGYAPAIEPAGAPQAPGSSPSGSPRPARESGLVYYADLLWRRRAFLWRVTYRAVLVAVVVSLLLPKRYESTIQLMPPDSNAGAGMLAALMGRAGGVGALAGDLLGAQSSSAVTVAVLNSRSVQDRIIDRFDLRKEYKDRTYIEARRDLGDYTVVTEDRKSGVIKLSVLDKDPRRAQQMARAYFEEVNRLLAEVSTSAARRQREFIEQRLKTAKSELDTSARLFSEFASQNSMADATEQTKAMVTATAELQGRMIAAQSELEGLQQIYTSENVRVRSAAARVAELKRELDKMAGVPSSSASKTSTEPKLYPSLKELPLLGVRWADLYRNAKVHETVYELLTQQYELARIEEAKEIPTLKLLDVPDLPEKKSTPHRSIIVAVTLLLAVLFSSAWVITSDVWQAINDENAYKRLLRDVGSQAAWVAAPAVNRVRSFAARFRRNRVPPDAEGSTPS